MTSPPTSRFTAALFAASTLLATAAASRLAAQDPATQRDAVPTSFTATTSTPLIRGLDVEVDLTIDALDVAGKRLETFEGTIRVHGARVGDASTPDADEAPALDAAFRDGRCELDGVVIPSGEIAVELPAARDTGGRQTIALRQVHGLLTILPPLLAIVLALLTRQVLISLFCGVWLGAAIVHGFNPLTALLRAADTYLVGALGDGDHAFIILFSLSLAGMVGVITRIGGVRGIVDVVARFARGPRSGQLATWLLGCVVFFDDYANSLIVGNTMRPFTDKVRISREKLAFIVDATAAPVATIGVISTWTAYQLGLLGDLGGPTRELIGQPYWFFLRSIPYSLYSFAALLLVFLSALTLRDIGAMRRAEARCRATGAVLRDGAMPLVDASLDRMGEVEGVRPRWYNAALPIVCVVLFTMLGLWATGRSAAGDGAPLHDVIGNADAYSSLLWGALGASLVAMALGVRSGQKVATVIDAWVQGARSLVLAVMILLLAWSISTVCKQVHTGEYIASLTEGLLTPSFLPAIAFVTAGVIAFSTGTSYGTMAILVPILLPLAAKLLGDAEVDAAQAQPIALAVLAAILGGSVFGDHCSPISDTTVLSSMAAGSDHIDHVRTQMPYALLGATVAAIAYVAVGFGVKVAIVLPGALVVTAIAFLALARSCRPSPEADA